MPMASSLMAHCGARLVTRQDLDKIPAPPPTGTWFPVKHGVVVDTVGRALTEGGFQIEKSQFAVSRSDARLFATMDLTAPLASGVSLAVGIRNSTDKSLPLGFCAGSRVNRKPSLNQAVCWKPCVSPTPQGTGCRQSAGKADDYRP